MLRFLRWLFWRLYYLPQRRPKDLASYLKRGMRCRWPWRKFRPSVYRKHDGNSWQVWLSEDEARVVSGVFLMVDAHVSIETGAIVGMTVYNSGLACLAKAVE